jgi:hypothetical protein
MIDKVVREQLLEDFEISPALDFFSISANHSLGGFAYACVCHHCLL